MRRFLDLRSRALHRLVNADGCFNGDYLLHWAEDGGDGHSFRPRTGEVFNYGPYNHLQRPDEKITAGGFLNYEINEHFEPYLEVMAMTNWTDAQIAPTGSFNEYNYINCDNPLLSDQQRETICGEGTGYGPTDLADVIIFRRNVEGGTRSNGLGHDNLRLVAGVRGDINDTWAYDMYLLHAQNNSLDQYNNDFNIQRMSNALDVIEGPDGEPMCRNGLGERLRSLEHLPGRRRDAGSARLHVRGLRARRHASRPRSPT